MAIMPLPVSSFVSQAASFKELNAWEVKYSLMMINRVYPNRPSSRHPINAYLDELRKCTGYVGLSLKMSNNPSGRNITGTIINNKQQIELIMINYCLICPVVNEGIDYLLISNYSLLSDFLNCRAMHCTVIHTIRITAKRRRGNRYIPSDKMPPNVVNEVKRFITTLITEIDVRTSIESTRF